MKAIDKANAEVRKWIKEEEHRILSSKAHNALFNNDSSSISDADRQQINKEIDRLLSIELRRDGKNRKTKQQITKEVYSKYRKGDL